MDGIVEYSSEEDEDEKQDQGSLHEIDESDGSAPVLGKRPRSPAADDASAQSNESKRNHKGTDEVQQEQEDDPYQGRMRTFPHVEGNYPGFIYIEFSVDDISKVADEATSWAESVFSPRTVVRIPQEDLHISLSRTFALRRPQIEPFMKQLKLRVGRERTFTAVLKGASLYSNEEGSRSFVGVNLTYGQEYLKALTRGVDSVMQKFSLPGYYDNPSFHVSVAWTLGGLPKDAPTACEEDGVCTAVAQMRVRNVKAKIGAYMYTMELKV
jgi:hypothetical protein